jgi:hypothetical protein
MEALFRKNAKPVAKKSKGQKKRVDRGLGGRSKDALFKNRGQSRTRPDRGKGKGGGFER